MATDRPSLGVAILGFGFIGKVHAYAHLNIPMFYDPPPLRTRLVGVATSNERSAAKAKALMGFEVATTDQLSLIRRDDVDIVHICTPNDLHCEALLAAIRAGKHIYCDKPLTATAEEAEQVAAALDGYKATGQMTFNYRFLPATLRAKQLVEEGRLGQISHFRGAYLHAGQHRPQSSAELEGRRLQGRRRAQRSRLARHRPAVAPARAARTDARGHPRVDEGPRRRGRPVAQDPAVSARIS